MAKKVALDKHLVMQRNYLIWHAHFVLGITLADVAKMFKTSKQMVFNIIKKHK